MAMGEEKSKIGWGTYVLAALWAAFLIAMAWAVPHHRQMFEGMGFRGDGRTAGTRPFKSIISFSEAIDKTKMALPFSTRVVVRIPLVLWIVLGLLVGGALIWKSKVLSRKMADLIDVFAVAALFGAGFFVAFALFMPYIVLIE